jgi:hypothetical protein
MVTRLASLTTLRYFPLSNLLQKMKSNLKMNMKSQNVSDKPWHGGVAQWTLHRPQEQEDPGWNPARV